MGSYRPPLAQRAVPSNALYRRLRLLLTVLLRLLAGNGILAVLLAGDHGRYACNSAGPGWHAALANYFYARVRMGTG